MVLLHRSSQARLLVPGYKFVGWSTEPASTVSGDVVYTALWEAVEPDPTPGTDDPTPTPGPDDPAPTPGDDDDNTGGNGSATTAALTSPATLRLTLVPQTAPPLLVKPPLPMMRLLSQAAQVRLKMTPQRAMWQTMQR